MYKKISLILIAFVIFVSSFSVLLNNKAFADELSAYPAEIPGVASKAAFGNLFWRCYNIAGAGGGEVSATNNSMPFKNFGSVAATVSAITTISPDDDEMSCENISETVFKNAMGSFGFKTSTPRADGDLAKFSITPHDNSLYLKWNARARTNLDPSDPRYVDIENERQRFEAYLKQEKDGALSISKISVEESTKQS